MTTPEIEMVPVTALRPWTKNARTHSPKQVKQIAESIRTFGFTNPVLIDSGNFILAGHGRVEAAKLLKLKEVPCIRLPRMSDEKKRAYVIADNKHALNAGWDEQLLAEEIQELIEIDPDFDFNVIGFAVPEIDDLIEGLNPEDAGDPADNSIPMRSVTRRCHPGDIFQLGKHRLICGDARDPHIVGALMNGAKAQMVFTDPPYNVPIDRHAGGHGKIKHREFEMAAGEMSDSEFSTFLHKAMANLAAHSLDGSIHFVCMDWRHMEAVMNAGKDIYSELKSLIVWVKDNGGLGTFYRSRHELIFAFKRGKAPHINTFGLGGNGRYRTNVWEYPGVNTLKRSRMEELASHPTAKPVQMIADAIKDVSKRGSIVLDLFGGSGSTLIAAHKTGRIAHICELDPLYCDLILARWEAFANDDAKLIASGITRSARVVERAAA